MHDLRPQTREIRRKGKRPITRIQMQQMWQKKKEVLEKVSNLSMSETSP